MFLYKGILPLSGIYSVLRTAKYWYHESVWYCQLAETPAIPIERALNTTFLTRKCACLFCSCHSCALCRSSTKAHRLTSVALGSVHKVVTWWQCYPKEFIYDLQSSICAVWQLWLRCSVPLPNFDGSATAQTKGRTLSYLKDSRALVIYHCNGRGRCQREQEVQVAVTEHNFSWVLPSRDLTVQYSKVFTYVSCRKFRMG